MAAQVWPGLAAVHFGLERGQRADVTHACVTPLEFAKRFLSRHQLAGLSTRDHGTGHERRRRRGIDAVVGGYFIRESVRAAQLPQLRALQTATR
ncbi:hypothetical protein ON010_g13806 [Phytophthora cinnamomi]|nr:hypothetical protein ON010_g13806 [Phytophthora cinnamomi]